MGNVHRRASGAAARRKILRVPKSEWIFMRVVPVRTKTFSIRRLDGDRFGCGATLTRGSGVPGQQLSAVNSWLAIYISGKSCNQAPAVALFPALPRTPSHPAPRERVVLGSGVAGGPAASGGAHT